MRINLLILVGLILVGLISAGAQVNGAQSNVEEDLLEMSIEELMEVPIVISGSRQEQKVTEAAVPIYIITAEDIHYSGLTSIGEILQFAPGVDMFKFNRYWDVVGVHGLHDLFADRVQVLINGRLADNANFGGPLFFTFPVFLEDIAQIEIVRGPGGAAWGANAFTGVINIITKKPEDVLGVLGSTTVSQYSDSYTHVRWAAQKDKWSWRISAGYEDVKTSDDALNGKASYTSYEPSLNGMIGFDSYVARDFAHSRRLDSEAVCNVSEDTQIFFGVGYSREVVGDYEMVGSFTRENCRYERTSPFVKIDHEYSESSSGWLQWSGNFDTTNVKNLMINKSIENSLDGQLDFSPATGHQMSVGGSFRATRSDSDTDSDQQFVAAGEPFDEQWVGLFVIDSWDATDRLTIEGQIRGDWYSEIQTDWSGRLAALYGLDEQKNHVLRFAAAKAFRSPLPGLAQTSSRRIPAGGGIYLVNIDKPGDLSNEETFSLETGYTGTFGGNVIFSANGYYQRFSKLIGYRSTTDALGLSHYRADNLDGADSWGGELEVAFENKSGKLSTWYAYNDFKEDRGHQAVRALLPSRHKAGVTGRLFLADGWTLNGNYKFMSTVLANPCKGNVADSEGGHRLDLTISKTIAEGSGEIMFGVSDLLNKTINMVRSNSVVTSHEVPGRTFFGRFQWRF